MPRVEDCEASLVDLIRRDAVNVPAYPSVALRIGKLTSLEDFDFQELIDLVSADQALAGAALRSANAAVFGSNARVTSVRAAVSRLGAATVTRLALATGLSGLAAGDGALAGLRRRIWQAALASAVICHHLAGRLGLSAEEGFTFGLLHDLGKLLGASAVEGVLLGRPELRGLPREDWEGLLERYHAELGLVAAARWNLPDAFAEVISRHHEVPVPEGAGGGFAVVVAASDQIVALLDQKVHLASADLGSLPVHLTPRNRSLLADFVLGVPGFLAAFESGLGSTPPPLLGSPAREPAGIVVRSLGAHPHDFQVMRVGGKSMELSGPAALPEHQVVRLQVETHAPFSLWATVQSTLRDGDRYRLRVAPMALSGEALGHWLALGREFA